MIAASLEGHYREELLFSLRQSVELYDIYQTKITDCDKAIQAQLDKMDNKGDKKDLPPSKKSKSKNTPKFDVRGDLYQMTGVDLTRIDGLNESSVLKILSETGSDISSWPTEKHFCSWLGLSPGNKVTGGKILSGKTKPSANRAAAAFRLAAFGLLNSKSALRTFYSMLKNGTEYVDKGQDYYEKQYQERIINNLKKRATEMGFELIAKDDSMLEISKA